MDRRPPADADAGQQRTRFEQDNAVRTRRGDAAVDIDQRLLAALSAGLPDCAGIALGIDRFVMLFAGLDNIRDCIAFPKTQRATDLMTGAPGEVDAGQLKELGIRPTRTE